VQRDLQGEKTASVPWSTRFPRARASHTRSTRKRQETREGINLVPHPASRLVQPLRHALGEVNALRRRRDAIPPDTLWRFRAPSWPRGPCAPARPIADAFAIVELVPPLAGVRVLRESPGSRPHRRPRPHPAAEHRLVLANYASLSMPMCRSNTPSRRSARTFSPSLRSGVRGALPCGAA
jgi:hypothetical protein